MSVTNDEIILEGDLVKPKDENKLATRTTHVASYIMDSPMAQAMQSMIRSNNSAVKSQPTTFVEKVAKEPSTSDVSAKKTSSRGLT